MVSPIGLGTVKLGRSTGVKYPRPFDIPDDASAAELLRAAQRLGITLIDTAPAYGEAEERLGRLLPACGGRDRWVIATKAGEEFDPATTESRFDFSPAAVRASVERSMKRLKTDRLDIVLLHSDGRDEWIMRESGGLDALEKLKKQGKVRAVGISTKTPAGGVLAVESGRCAVVMLTLNLRQQDDLPAIRAAAERGVGVLIKKALASGHILSEPEAQAREDAHALSEPEAPAREESLLDQSLRFVLSQQGVSSVIIGTISPSHLIENVRAVERVLGWRG